MMKAVVVHKYGGPEELKFEEVPDPVPAAGLPPARPGCLPAEGMWPGVFPRGMALG